MPQFDVSSFSSQFFWLALVFAGLYFIISKFIAPKAESILSARNRCIEDNISYAQNYQNQAKSLNIEKQEKFDEVNLRVEEMQKQALDIIESNFKKQRAELAGTLDDKRQVALKEIEQYIDKFHADEVEPCVNIAALIIQKITNKPADLKLLREIHLRK